MALDVIWFVEVDGRYELLEFVHWWLGCSRTTLTRPVTTIKLTPTLRGAGLLQPSNTSGYPHPPGSVVCIVRGPIVIRHDAHVKGQSTTRNAYYDHRRRRRGSVRPMQSFLSIWYLSTTLRRSSPMLAYFRRLGTRHSGFGSTHRIVREAPDSGTAASIFVKKTPRSIESCWVISARWRWRH